MVPVLKEQSGGQLWPNVTSALMGENTGVQGSLEERTG